MKEATRTMLHEAAKTARKVADTLETTEEFTSVDFFSVVETLEKIQRTIEVAHDIEYRIV